MSESSLPRKGKVIWFNEIKGFGFICDAETSEDIYVDYDAVIREGFRTLYEGELVEFFLQENEGGLKARHVVPKGFAPSEHEAP